jgi:hypothetical protein
MHGIRGFLVTTLKTHLLLLLLCTAFENTRAELSFFLPTMHLAFSIARDILLFGCLIWILFHQKVKFECSECVLFFAIFASVLFSINRIDEANEYWYFRSIYSYFRVIAVFFICRNLARNLRLQNWLANSIVSLTIMVVMVNIVVFLWFRELILRDQGIRVSIGNASIHSAFLGISLLIATKLNNFRPSIFLRVSRISITLAGILTATATFFVFICGFWFTQILFAGLKLAQIRHIERSEVRETLGNIESKLILNLLFKVGFIGFCAGSFFAIKHSEPELFDSIFQKFFQAFQTIAKLEPKTVGTMSIRELQFETIPNATTLQQFFFGLGPGGYLQFSNLLENQFYVFYANFGFFGLVGFCFFVLSGIWKATFKGKKLKLNPELLSLWLLFVFYSWTLEIFISLQILAFMSFAVELLKFEKVEPTPTNTIICAAKISDLKVSASK